MIVKERVYDDCGTCGNKKLISDEEYGCDKCKKKIRLRDNNSNADYLEITVFYHNKEAEPKHFCCWNCVFKYLLTIKTDHFISLPFLQCSEDTTPGCTIQDFFNTMNKFKLTK